MWGVARFTSMRNFSISRHLLSKYLHQPYVFFLNKNTVELGKNILSEVAGVTAALVQLMQIISSGIVALFIFAMLIAVEPLLSLSVMVILTAAYIFIYRIVKKKINIIGKRRFVANTELYKVVNEAFGGIKQLKLLGFEEVFINRYSKPSFEFSKITATNQIISRTPRYIMEVVAIGGIISVVLYLLAFDRGFQDTLPIIGLFAFASYRIMPALQNIFASATALRFYIPAVDVLYEDMCSFENKPYTTTDSKKNSSPFNLQKELKLEEITFSYPGTRKPVIDNLNIKIDYNTSVAFVGKTGVGKTTIADIILGLLRPTSGRMLVELTGRSIVAHQQEHRFREAPYKVLRVGLCLDRERLNDRIERRTDRMIADGFAEEVRRLLDMGYTESLKSMQSLGYRNMVSFLAGRQSLEEAVRLIKRDSCRYAKRQMTWFAADREVGWLDPGDVDAASKRIGLFLNRYS